MFIPKVNNCVCNHSDDTIELIHNKEPINAHDCLTELIR